jgi:steroid 5-alpha reductase family enzyme
MMEFVTWTDWAGLLVLGVVMFAGTIAGLREARRFREDPDNRKRDKDPAD